MKIDNFQFTEDKPQEDSFLYSLVKGGLRAVTGIVGKRSKDKYELGTATASTEEVIAAYDEIGAAG